MCVRVCACVCVLMGSFSGTFVSTGTEVKQLIKSSGPSETVVVSTLASIKHTHTHTHTVFITHISDPDVNYTNALQSFPQLISK